MAADFTGRGVVLETAAGEIAADDGLDVVAVGLLHVA